MFNHTPSLSLQSLEIYQRVNKEVIYRKLASEELEPFEEVDEDFIAYAVSILQRDCKFTLHVLESVIVIDFLSLVVPEWFYL